MQHIYTVLIRLPAHVEVLMNPGRWKHNNVEFPPSGGSRFYTMGFVFFKSLQCSIQILPVIIELQVCLYQTLIGVNPPVSAGDYRLH